MSSFQGELPAIEVMKKRLFAFLAAPVVIALTGLLLFHFLQGSSDEDQLHYEHGETALIVSNLTNATVELYKAGRNAAETTPILFGDGRNLWLSPGNYFLRSEESGRLSFYPIPLTGYHSGPDKDGSFLVTLRPMPKQFPPRLLNNLPEFAYIPAGNFLLGDRMNPREPHQVWLSGFFIAPFEVTNEEFREFVKAPDGYRDDARWTEQGRRWKSSNTTHVTALLRASESNYKRFGQPDQPLVWVNWFEANAFCRWMSEKYAFQKWLFALPTDAEWEKAARGPDNFDYALGMSISDNEVHAYNWKKNPWDSVTVVGAAKTPARYLPNRYGLYHMTGNVAEWTQSTDRPYNREHPYEDDERNHDNTPGLRTARGGSWYSASIAYLYIPYRDSFQPEHSTQDIGFRIVARALP